MTKRYLYPAVLLGALVLSGCTTEEVRQREAIKDNLDFSSLKQEAAESETVAEPKETKPVTTKKMYSYPPVVSIDTAKKYTATMKTSAGEMVIALHAKETPITANNFIFLAREKFYDSTIFHRTIPGFMIQGGDPQGTGMGGPGYKFDDEPFTGEYERGTLAMANAGPDTNGSQFFIMHKDYPLPPNYVIFGKVTSGLEVIDKIAEAPTKPGGEGSSPVTPVTIESVTITEE
jgi:cyclophilin family peptidyl-prolyl cis-trans isomerase